MGVFALIGVIAFGWMIHAGVFFQTGSQWFQSCWNEKHEQRMPATPEESIAWAPEFDTKSRFPQFLTPRP